MTYMEKVAAATYGRDHIDPYLKYLNDDARKDLVETVQHQMGQPQESRPAVKPRGRKPKSANGATTPPVTAKPPEVTKHK